MGRAGKRIYPSGGAGCRHRRAIQRKILRLARREGISRRNASIHYAMATRAVSVGEKGSFTDSYQQYVNPQWVALLNLLDMNVHYQRCSGAELFTADGRRILDFLSGYCVHNSGHNHPRVVEALIDELGRNGPNMLQSHVPELAGELADKLCARAGGGLTKVFFNSSGSEGVETAIKFARAKTKRTGLLYAQ